MSGDCESCGHDTRPVGLHCFMCGRRFVPPPPPDEAPRVEDYRWREGFCGQDDCQSTIAGVP